MPSLSLGPPQYTRAKLQTLQALTTYAVTQTLGPALLPMSYHSALALPWHLHTILLLLFRPTHICGHSSLTTPTTPPHPGHTHVLSLSPSPALAPPWPRPTAHVQSLAPLPLSTCAVTQPGGSLALRMG